MPVSPKEVREKPKPLCEPRTESGVGPLMIPETIWNSKALLLAHSSYFSK